jgi:uncharacterized protein with FMN-binding domain
VSTRRNATVALLSASGLGLLMLYPTSTNSSGAHRRPGAAAPAGVVRTPGPVTAPGAAADVQVNGASVGTPYGPVQVQLVVRAGRVVRATALDYPQGGSRDREINSYAIPVLEQETVAARSARIDSVSGATYTSDGYRQSLQSALDAAHLG